MSASAGRVLIIPRGDYDSQTTYNMLDMVYYGGKTYVCKQTSTGNLPTNTVYWQIMIDSAGSLHDLSDVDITNPQNGDGIAYNATTHKWENTSPVSIQITSPPAKTSYNDGDLLDLTGMVVTAFYSTGTTRNITTECIFSPANGTTLTTSDTSVSVSWLTFTATQAITVIIPIYGAEWDGSSSPAWTRTDNAVNFVDPIPYYSGMTETPSSPFDDISPWKDMTEVEDTDAGTMVKIPKFYCKVDTTNGMKVQISMSPFTGSYVSPAHMDRGDGQGERDFVYISKYYLKSNYKSVTGETPLSGGNISTYRTGIKNLGSEIHMYDIATHITLWMLYLVEYAHWDSEAKIGVGWYNMYSDLTGRTDSILYHTGTTSTSRTTKGYIKYRNIEAPWGMGQTFVDGITENLSYEVVATKNPSLYGTISSYTDVGLTLHSFHGLGKTWQQSEVSGYEWLIAPKTGQNMSNPSDFIQYCCDFMVTDSTQSGDNAMVVGGAGDTYGLNGLFSTVYCVKDSYSYSHCRSIKLPNAS